MVDGLVDYERRNDMHGYLLLLLLLRIAPQHCFNLDLDGVSVQLGPPHSSFGFDVALHLRRDEPL